MTKVSKNIVSLVLISTVVLLSSSAMAATSKIAGGKHDFTAAGGAFYHDPTPGSTQTCVYCHTPHNAGQTRLLWNKDVKSATTFRLYTSSGTLTNVVRTQSSLSANSPSLLCLSCHDGKTAINVLHTGGKGTSAPGYPAGSAFAYGNAELIMPGSTTDFFGNAGPNLAIGRGVNDRNDFDPTTGDNLTDDHPIGFSYSAVLVERSAGLNPIATPQSAGIRFFGPNNKVECSTCHDPHVNYNGATGGDVNLKPFLVMSNSGSALCLKCHNK